VTQHGAGKPATVTLILEAARRLIAERGAAAVSLQDIADGAAVSKALIHYHFVDRETLLARLVDATARDLIERERGALRVVQGVSAVDGLWTWLETELARGDIRVLLEVSQDRAPRVQEAARIAASLRAAAAAATVERLFALLGLRPRLDPELLAGAVVAFTDGLAFDAPLTPDRSARASFDVFWLALLSLAE
jgi:AcrR family transcriptional regulator